MKFVASAVVVVLCLAVAALTYGVSGNPLYAAMMGFTLFLFGVLAIRAVGG